MMIAVQVAVGVLIAFAVIKIFPMLPLKAYRILFDIVSLICSAVVGAIFWSYIFENPNVLDIGTAVILISMWLGVTVSIHEEGNTVECFLFIFVHFISFAISYFVLLKFYGVTLVLAAQAYFIVNSLLNIAYCMVIDGKKIPYTIYMLAFWWTTLYGAVVFIMFFLTMISLRGEDGLFENNAVYFILTFISMFCLSPVYRVLASEGIRWSKFRL